MGTYTRSHRQWWGKGERRAGELMITTKAQQKLAASLFRRTNTAQNKDEEVWWGKSYIVPSLIIAFGTMEAPLTHNHPPVCQSWQSLLSYRP